MVGNSAANILDGGLGADSLEGGSGNDTYVVDEVGDAVVEAAAAGTDIVQSAISWTLAANVENLVLTGVAAIDGTGNALVNNLTGNAAANRLDGGAGADTMQGGVGDDLYIVDNVGDHLVEAAGAGVDTVQSSVTLALAANVDNLVLTGASAINGTGNTLINILTGNAAANILNGGAGADTMAGGLGNDTYVVDNVADMVSEAAAAGTDNVQSSVTHALAANVENLTLSGAGAINGTGNALANTITGNAGANTLDGAGGADTMTGGLGNDTYVVDEALDKAVEAAGGGTDRVLSSVTFTLGGEVENLTLTGAAAINGTGNTLVNVVTGNSAANILNGGVGADTMQGGAGDDTYIVDNALDRAVELNAADGIDTVQTSVAFTLTGYVENLDPRRTRHDQRAPATPLPTASSATPRPTRSTAPAAPTRWPAASATTPTSSTMPATSVTEAAGAGTDLVRSALSHTLGANVENLILTGATSTNGTGNALANTHHRQWRRQRPRRRRRRRHDERRRRQRHLYRRRQSRPGLRDQRGQRHRHRPGLGRLCARRQYRESDPARHARSTAPAMRSPTASPAMAPPTS